MVMDRLTTLGPGMIWATAQSSTNSSLVSQRFFSTSSRCTTASTPPKPCRASQVKDQNRSRRLAGAGRCAGASAVSCGGGNLGGGGGDVLAFFLAPRAGPGGGQPFFLGGGPRGGPLFRRL